MASGARWPGRPGRRRRSGTRTASLRLLLRAAGRARPSCRSGGLGWHQVLLAVPDERLRWFVQRHLGPIAHRDDLLRTLDCWLATGGSRQAVSERLHLHRNSVGYRVGLIKRLLGVDPARPATTVAVAAYGARRAGSCWPRPAG